MYRTYKRKLDLTVAQEKRILNWIGTCRMVYNLGLETRIYAYKSHGITLSSFDIMKQITHLKKDYSWISDVSSNTLADIAIRLNNAYKLFFKGGGFPKFKKKSNLKSIVIRQNIICHSNKIRLQKIGWVKLFKDSIILEDVKQVTISKKADGFYASILCSVEYIEDINTSHIGIDMGLKYFSIDSNANFIENPKHFKKYERKIRIENRSLARKKKFSKSWYKQSHKLSLVHNKVANVRKDFIHKQSTLIAKKHGTVYLENLKITNMVNNGNLSKHISDAGWGMFKEMLSYKTNVILVDPKYTSQTCNECGLVDGINRATQSEFKCIGCGHMANADVNAAKNIMSKGMALMRERKAVA